MPSANPPPQDHYNPGDSFTRTHGEQEDKQNANRSGGILGRWWPTTASDVGARAASSHEDEHFDHGRAGLDRAQRNISQAAAGAKGTRDHRDDHLHVRDDDVGAAAAASGVTETARRTAGAVKSWWNGDDDNKAPSTTERREESVLEGIRDAKRVDWNLGAPGHELRDDNRRRSTSEGAGSKLDDLKTDLSDSFGNMKEGLSDKLHSAQDKLGDAIGYGKREAQGAKQWALGGGTSSSSATRSSYLSKARNSGYCTTQLDGYERCLESNGNDPEKCKAQWENFLVCQEHVPKSSH